MNPIRLLPRFREAYRAMKELETRESWSRGQIEALQLERLNALWAHAISHVPYYRRLARERDLPPRFANLEEFRSAVPLLQREHLARSRDFRSEIAAPGQWSRTSGSTGTAIDVYWSHAAHREMLRAKYRFLASWGIDIFDRSAFLWGSAGAFDTRWRSILKRLLQPATDRLRNRIRLSAYELHAEHLRRHLARMTAFRPRMLYAYSTAAYLLANEALAEGVVCDALRLVVLSAEPVFPWLRETVRSAFRAPTVMEYGSVECGLLATEGTDGVLRVREDVALLETLPRADGFHDIVVSVLNNPSFPLLRYQIGDVTNVPLESSAQGFTTLHQVSGRDQDHLLTRSGRRIHGLLVDVLFETQPNARRWRVHQQPNGSLAVTLELHDRRQALDAVRLEGMLEQIVEGYPVRVEVVSTLTPTLAGKHRWVHSDLAVPPTPGQNSA